MFHLVLYDNRISKMQFYSQNYFSYGPLKGGPSGSKFSLRTKKKMGLKHWILPKDHFKTHLFFSIFGWGDPSQLGSWSEGCVKPFKLSREAISYRICFMSSRSFFVFLFFFPLTGVGVRRLVENSTIFFLNPSLILYENHSDLTQNLEFWLLPSG